MIYTKSDFQNFWPNGYVESFPSRPELKLNLSQEEQYNIIVKPFENKKHTCLEIGPGGGVWTNKFVNVFDKVIAIDVIPRSSKLSSRIIYYELDSFDYLCSNIEDNSIDFVFSYGCFCHLPLSAQFTYVKNILRVLKNNGNAVIMFADWKSHTDLSPLTEDINLVNDINKWKEEVSEGGWFYMDTKIINDIMNENFIKQYTDMLPNFRDRIIHFKKETLL